MIKWEEVANDPWTLRLEVPGGWLYNVVSLTEDGSQYTNAVAFVPDDVFLTRRVEAAVAAVEGGLEEP